MELYISIIIFIISTLLAIIGFLSVNKLSNIDKSILSLNCEIQKTNEEIQGLRIDITDIHGRVKHLEHRVDNLENPFSKIKYNQNG